MSTISTKINNESILSQLRDMQAQLRQTSSAAADEEVSTEKKGPAFIDLLKNNIEDVNNMQKTADKMATDLVIGKSQNLHETMLAATKAELSFNLMVQIRNKILEAYQEVMRMQV